MAATKGAEVSNPTVVVPGAMVTLKLPKGRRSVSGVVLAGGAPGKPGKVTGLALIYVGGNMERQIDLATCKVLNTWVILNEYGVQFTVYDTLKLHHRFAARVDEVIAGQAELG